MGKDEHWWIARGYQEPFAASVCLTACTEMWKPGASKKKRTGNPRYHLCPHSSHENTFSGVCFCRVLSPAEAKLFRNNLCSRKEKKLNWIPWRETQKQWSHEKIHCISSATQNQTIKEKTGYEVKQFPGLYWGLEGKVTARVWNYIFPLCSQLCSTQDDPAKENPGIETSWFLVCWEISAWCWKPSTTTA